MELVNEIQLFNLSNGVIDVVLCNYGGTILSVNVPGRDGQKKNVVAGFASPEAYKNNQHYLGCTVGRVANRIAFGKFTIDGKHYQLECNNGLNHLHGGTNAFHKKIWKAEETGNGLVFHYLSKDGEEGYPGNLNVTVKFSFADDNRFVIQYSATTDKPTIINLTNHTYFNLSGFDHSTIYDHFLKVNAKNFTVKNENNTPSGEIRSVSGTPYDFRESKRLGKDINALPADMGYDMNYVLDGNIAEDQACAELYETVSGRLLKVFTTMPGLQVYTANWWNGSDKGAQNKFYQKHGAVALETQFFPDAPNHPNFPNIILRPGEKYQHETIYQFVTINDY
jgi:aldose 1-epimerase